MARETAKVTDWREARRLRAWELSREGWSQSAIARALGVTRGSVSHWMKCVHELGEQGLHRRLGAGRPPKLSAEQRAQLPGLLAQGAEAYGFRGNVWTRERVGEVIHRVFGVILSSTSVDRLLRESGWNLQKPARRA